MARPMPQRMSDPHHNQGAQDERHRRQKVTVRASNDPHVRGGHQCPILDTFVVEGKKGYDLSKIEFQWGSTPEDVPAYTFGDKVTINKTWWDKASPLERLKLVAHEVTHSLQYDVLGVPAFLSRDKGEYERPDNYVWPGGPIPTDPTDPRFTLDQIAERVKIEAELRSRAGK
jgi:hypothetical protein